LLRTRDDKTRAFTRANEDATAEWQQAEQDAINVIGRKMINVITDYAQKNAFGLVVDVSSPQTPVLYADEGLNITDQIIELYNQTAAKPAASGSAPAAPAATGTSAPAGSAAPASAP
jgi:outer membrane protein